MKAKKTQLHLGASMYVPATRDPANLAEIGNGRKYPNLRSVIYCTEDAVLTKDVDKALRHLGKALRKLESGPQVPMRFIRVRNPDVLGKVLRMRGIQNIDGFVLPKIYAENLQPYMWMLTGKDEFSIMPTLETKEVFNGKEMAKLRILLEKPGTRERVLCLRIGGNDLLNCLRVRRDPTRTIYETPVGEVIKRLAGEFIPHGFGLSAPVCEVTNPANLHVLREELALDLMQGLFGKTVIHPDHIEVVEEAYRVCGNDHKEATAILAPDAPAVFKMHNRMCEPTTHRFWASDIVLRGDLYGIRDAQGSQG